MLLESRALNRMLQEPNAVRNRMLFRWPHGCFSNLSLYDEWRVMKLANMDAFLDCFLDSDSQVPILAGFGRGRSWNGPADRAWVAGWVRGRSWADVILWHTLVKQPGCANKGRRISSRLTQAFKL